MEQILFKTHDIVALKKGELRYTGNGFGALEELRSGRKLAPQLDFGSTTPMENDWVSLLQTGKMTAVPPCSFQVDPDWLPLLKQMPDCWKKQYHLALYYFHQQDAERAEAFSMKALQMSRNAWTLHAHANVLLRFGGDTDQALSCMIEAALTPDADAYLIKETFKLLVIHQQYKKVVELYQKVSDRDRSRPNVRVHYAAALFQLGDAQKALNILMKDGPIDLPDVREGESFLTKLYFDIQHALGKKDDEFEIPLSMDFRTK